MLWKERSREKMGSGKTSWRRKTHKLRLEGGGGKCRQRRKSWPSYEAAGWCSGVWLCQVIYLTTFVVVWSLSCVWLLVTAWTAAYQATLSFTISQSLLKFMSLGSAMLYNHLILCCLLFLLPSIFPSIRVFFFSQWVSSLHHVAKELGLQLQHQPFQWIFRVDFLEDWLVWSLCSPRDSQESSPVPHFESISSLVLSLLYDPALTSVHVYWKNHSFDYMGLCRHSDVFAL